MFTIHSRGRGAGPLEADLASPSSLASSSQRKSVSLSAQLNLWLSPSRTISRSLFWLFSSKAHARLIASGQLLLPAGGGMSRNRSRMRE